MKFDLEHAIKDWRKSLFRNESLEDGYVAELESHLREDIDRLKITGMPEPQAFRSAVERLGPGERIGDDYAKTDARGLLSRPLPRGRHTSFALFLSTMKLAFRKIKRQRGYSLLNISGLAVGMACCILILVWVQDELRYDRFHPNHDRIFRILTEVHSGGEIMYLAGAPAPLGKTMMESFPEVEQAVRVQSGWKNWHLHYGDKHFLEERLAAVDPEFFQVFPFPFVQGDPETALAQKFSIVLTESLAGKCFGDEDPMGKVMKISGTDMTVTGVIRDIPRTSTIQFEYAFQAEHMRQWRSSQLDSWSYLQFATFVVLREGADPAALNRKLDGFVKKYDSKSRLQIELQPLADVHLRSSRYNNWMTEYPNPGNITYIYIFSLTAGLILLLACINFMNLATARSATRAREVGMRKVSGAGRFDLMRQFLGESLLLTFMSLAGALLLVGMMLPAFNRLSGKTIELAIIANPATAAGLLAITLITGLISGSYPAFYLSAFQPFRVLKSSLGTGIRSRIGFRRVLVVLQFAVTTVLIIVTFVISRQLHFIRNKDLGYNKDNIISFAAYGKFDDEYDAVKAELLQNPALTSITRAFPPTQGMRRTADVDWEGKDPGREFHIVYDLGDYDFLKTFEIRMAEGRFYSPEFQTDRDNFVLNQTAVREMGLKSPIGKRFSARDRSGIIIGIVEDYHGGSLHQPIEPKVIELNPGFFICIRFQGDVAPVLAFLEEKWKTYVPGEPFRYSFLDESVDNHYRTERRIARVFRYATGVAVLIACLGLLGLASYTAERRTREIGIRKVLGARVSGIILLLSRDFARWILIANLIAWPMGYFIGTRWLRGFAYRAGLGWEIFVLSSGAALILALLTVSWQAFKVATTDPVRSLRYE